MAFVKVKVDALEQQKKEYEKAIKSNKKPGWCFGADQKSKCFPGDRCHA